MPSIPHTFNIPFCYGCSASPFHIICLVFNNISIPFYSSSLSLHIRLLSLSNHPTCQSFHTSSMPFHFTSPLFHTVSIPFYYGGL